MSIDQARYEAAKEKIIGIHRERLGIGTLAEKTVHAVLKNYYAPNEDNQEIPIENHVADIYKDGEIIEIQTRSFDKLRKKLEVFLPLYSVTIVYPIPRTKWLIWIDEKTGEFTEKRKSPKKGTVYDAFKELYKIKSFLTEENLKIKIVLLDMEEYRLLNGWGRDKKRGSHRFDRIPQDLVDEIDLERAEDYLQLIPYDLKEPFDTKEYAKAVKIRKEQAGTVLHILYYLQLVERVGKKGNAYLYKVLEK